VQYQQFLTLIQANLQAAIDSPKTPLFVTDATNLAKLFLLQGCRDSQNGVGHGFMVETVQGDLRPVRSVLEAYNATTIIEGARWATACGIGINTKSTDNITVRVNGTSLYTLDRWV
jgi:hypothetical protein